jgi:hypothetical protein
MKSKEEEFKQELLTHDGMVHHILTSHMIPKDLFDKKGELKQETLEESAEKYAEGKSSNFSFRNTHIRDFKAGAKWQSERMYSEEELREAFKQGHSSARKGSYNQITEQEDFDKWFEQFKKK